MIWYWNRKGTVNYEYWNNERRCGFKSLEPFSDNHIASNSNSSEDCIVDGFDLCDKKYYQRRVKVLDWFGNI